MDKTVNTFGAELLDMCYIHKMRILNGDCDGNREGEFTFVSHSGSSVNDYYLCVSLDFPESKIVQVHVSPRVESRHMPVSLTLNTARQHGARATADCSHKTRLARQPDTNIPKQCQVKCVYKYSGRGD